MGIVLELLRSAIHKAWSAVCGIAGVAADSPPTGAGGRNRLRQCLDQMNLPGVKHAGSQAPADVCTPVNPDVLNARLRIGREPDGDSWRSVLIVEICGTIESPEEGHDVSLQVFLNDVTEDAGQSLPILTRPKHGPLQGSAHFVYQNPMGKLCNRTTVLQDWTTIAQLSPEWFVLPRQGTRRLQGNLAIVSQGSGQRLATASGTVIFENIEIGYLDIEDNIQRAKTLAVGLAFSVAAADNELADSELGVIQGWIRTNFGSMHVSAAARAELDRAMQKTVAFFRKGGRLNVSDICREVAEIAPLVGRIDIMDLCLRVAGAKGQVTPEEMSLLKELSQQLAIDRARLRTMVEKILPVHMHTSQDVEMILGVTETMSQEETRHQLNREYAKWSSRVISSDPSIRKQADQMLNLLANARTQYVGIKPVAQKA